MMKLSNIRMHRKIGKEIVTELEVIKFTDEIIISVEYKDGLLFATTEAGMIWVSDDKGQTWNKLDEILGKLAKHYEQQLEDVARAYHDKLVDIERDYLKKIQRYEI